MAQKTATQNAKPGLGIDADTARRLFRDMVLIRRFEEKAAEAYALGKIGGFLHLSIGEEAVAAGVTSALRPDDYQIGVSGQVTGVGPKVALALLSLMNADELSFAIASGLAVVFGMVAGRLRDGWTTIFVWTTVLTSVTGFGFPFDHLLPSHKVGIISLVVLAVAILALYVYRLAGSWRWIYVAGAVLALYLNVFVGVAQAFEKLPFLNRLAPTQSEPPFFVAQLIVMAIFVVLGILAVMRLRPTATRPV